MPYSKQTDQNSCPLIYKGCEIIDYADLYDKVTFKSWERKVKEKQVDVEFFKEIQKHKVPSLIKLNAVTGLSIWGNTAFIDQNNITKLSIL